MIGVTDWLAGIRAQAVADALALGAGTPAIDIYDGVRPAVAGGSTAANILVSIPLPRPVGTIAAGAIALNIPASTLISISGSASWGRVVAGTGDIAFDCDVSLDGDGGEIVLDTLSLFSGGNCNATSGGSIG